MAKSVDTFMARVRKKQSKANKIFRQMHTTEEEREANKDILDEILEQIEICEGLCRPVTDEQIQEWLQCENVMQVSRKIRSHKFAA